MSCRDWPCSVDKMQGREGHASHVSAACTVSVSCSFQRTSCPELASTASPQSLASLSLTSSVNMMCNNSFKFKQQLISWGILHRNCVGYCWTWSTYRKWLYCTATPNNCHIVHFPKGIMNQQHNQNQILFKIGNIINFLWTGMISRH